MGQTWSQEINEEHQNTSNNGLNKISRMMGALTWRQRGLEHWLMQSQLHLQLLLVTESGTLNGLPWGIISHSTGIKNIEDTWRPYHLLHHNACSLNKPAGHVCFDLHPQSEFCRKTAWISERLRIHIVGPGLGPFGVSFARSAVQRRHNMGNIAQHTCHRCQTVGNTNENGRFEAFLFTGHVPILKPCGPQLGPKLLPNGSQTDSIWGQVAACWTQVGAKLESSGSGLGPSWGLVGQWWPQVEPMLRTCGVETVHLEDVGPICKMRKLPQSRSGDLFVSLAAKRPGFGAFGAGRFPRAFPIHACELIYIYMCVFLNMYFIFI